MSNRLHNIWRYFSLKNMSMVEIAKLSGVSIATVSRVLNKNGRYSPETERRVMKVVNENNYQINPNAKGLRTHKTNSIGMIVPDITNEFFGRIIRSVENSTLPFNYTVVVCDSNENSQLEKKYITDLVAKNVDGIILISTELNVKSIYNEYKIPAVYIDRRPENAGTLIVSDNERGGYLAAEELIKNGCKKIVHLRDQNVYSTVRHRYAGFCKAHQDYGIELDEELVLKIPVCHNDAYSAIQNLIKSGKKFDGIFCENDQVALGALHAVMDAGLSIPDDVKIVGFDDTSFASLCSPALTSIRQDTDALGKSAVEHLFRLIQGDITNDAVCVLPVELVRRSTT